MPFYFAPIANRLFSSHSLAKSTLVGLFIYIIIIYTKAFSEFISKNRLLFIILVLYFLGQSLSVIYSSDILLFWKSYHNVIINIIIFTLSYFIISSNEKSSKIIDKFILFTGITLIIFELVFFLFSNYLVPLLSFILQKEIMDSYLTNIARGRYTLELNTELFLPFLLAGVFVEGIKTDGRKRILLFLITLILIYSSILSNFRSRVVELIFALLAFSLIYYHQLKKILRSLSHRFLLSLFCFGLVTIIYVAVSTSDTLNSFNIVDRFLLQSDKGDLSTVEFRINSAYKSVEMFQSSPVFGIGLGNYVNFASSTENWGFYLVNQGYEKAYQEAVQSSPHNIFMQTLSETGFVGILTFVLILGFFLKRDFNILSRKNKPLGLIGAYIISSWSIIIYTLFNPPQTIFVIGWFWFLRGAIEGVKNRNTEMVL